MAPFSISNSMSKISTAEDFLPPEPPGAAPGKGDDAISNERILRGDLLAERYRVLSDPVHGGMGSVWRVEDPETGKELCMKRPQPKYFTEGGTARRELFIHECESWISLGLHPQITACYYVREIGGVPTIFAEWMKGGSLEDRIQDKTLYAGTEEERQKRILRIALQFARGLRYAHERGMIHRDVKPDNVLLTENGEARVADFGLSGAYAALDAEKKAAGGESPEMPGGTILVGSGGYTEAYCSPEQEARKELTRRTDIYSWAVSMMEVYCGELRWNKGPEAGQDPAGYLEDAAVRPPEGMKELLARCLNLDEAGRPHDFGAVEAELEKIYRECCGEAYGEAEAVPSGSADGLNNMAVSYMEIGRKDTARACWEKAEAADPSHAETAFNRGLYEWRAGVRTGREVWNRLITYPYYKETEAGQKALSALARESGKPSMETDLKAVTALHHTDWRRRVCRLWRGKVYVLGREDGLRVIDPETWQEIRHIGFAGEFSGEDRKIRAVSLNADCSQVLIHLSDNTLVFRDIASGKNVREAKLGDMSMYDSVNFLETFGAGSRFVRRSVSHGMGHVPPTPELYDLRLGKMISAEPYAFNPWQLILADEAKGDEPAEPAGKEYRCSFSDGLRAVPVCESGGKLMYCGRDGKPAAPVPPALASRLGDINSMNMNRGCLRITEDGRMWMLGNEGLMEFDLASGKCLRSYAIRAFHDRIRVDEDGLGILMVTAGEGVTGDTADARYCRLEPVRAEDRAPYAFSAPESYAEYLERTRRLNEITESFRAAAEEKDRKGMCEAYREANLIHRFPGSGEQREMARRLNETCRQKDGELFLCGEEEIPAAGKQRKQALAPFGGAGPEREALRERLMKEKWCSIGMRDRIQVSEDGRRALICTSPDAKGAPAGPGVYLLDGESGKLYLVPGASGTLWGCAGFCRDRRHIVHGDLKKTDLRLATFDGGGVREAAAQWVKAPGDGRAMLSADRLPETAEPSGMIWRYGLYCFRTEEDRRAFFAQEGTYLQILDVSEEYGLIAYQVRNESFTCTVRVWSADERRILLDRPLEGYGDSPAVSFARDGEGPLRMLLAPSGLEARHGETSVPAEIYQFGCGYSPEDSRRRQPGPVPEWPEITLEECPWNPAAVRMQTKPPAGAGEPEAVLDKKGYELSHVKTADSLTQAYDVYCELVRRFPAKEHHRKNRDITVKHLKAALQKMREEGDTDGLEKAVQVFRERMRKDPGEEQTPEVLNFAEDQLAYILSGRNSLQDLSRALELYRGLSERQPRVPAHSRNMMVVSALILRKEREEKKKEKEAQGRKSLLSFFRKK